LPTKGRGQEWEAGGLGGKEERMILILAEIGGPARHPFFSRDA